MSVKTWIVLDDDPDLRKIIIGMCVLWDIVPIEFSDGYEAHDWLKQIEFSSISDPPEVAVLDIRLPGPSGIEIAQYMRQIPALDHTVIVLMTAYTLSEEEQAQLIGSTADLLLRKPLPSVLEFKQLIEEAIDSHRSRAE